MTAPFGVVADFLEKHMRPYVVEDPNDSLRACLASIHELPLSEVPRFDMLDESDTWLAQLNRWAMKRFGSKWVAALYMQDEEGNIAHDGLWVPPGWYIEAAETDDGSLTIFQACSGNVVMHRPYQMVDADFTAKMRMWMVVIDPAMAWPQE